MNERTNALKPQISSVPLNAIQVDQNQPRSDLKHLSESIEQTGLHSPLIVCKRPDGDFRLIDGHRRYQCFERIGLSPVPCLVYGELTEGQIESLRLVAHTTRKNWTPFEKAEVVGRMQRACGARTAGELADFANAPIASVTGSLLLLDAGIQRMAAFAEYGLSHTYCDELMRLRVDFCKVKEIQPTEMDEIVLRKVRCNAIGRAKDFRRLKGMFKTLPAHEDALHRFLTEPDMTVNELCVRAESSNLAVDLERAARSISERLRGGSGDSERGRAAIRRLQALCEDVLRREACRL